MKTKIKELNAAKKRLEAIFAKGGSTDENRKLYKDIAAEIADLELGLPQAEALTNKDSGAVSIQGSGSRMPLALEKGQRLTEYTPVGKGDDWGLADFVRSNMGIKGAVTPSTATVPLFIGAEIIDDVRVRSRIFQAGARTFPLTGPTNICRIDADPTVYQHTAGADDVSEASPTLTAVEFDPESLMAVVPISFEVAQDSKNLDQALRTSLSGAFALKLDSLGIATLLADGDIPTTGGEATATWAGMLAGLSSALDEDQDIPVAIISNSADFAARAALLASTAGSWLGAPPVLADALDLFTSGMTEGTAMMGDYSRGVAVAIRQDLTLELVRFGKPTSGSHLLVATMRAEVFVTQPKALYKVVTA